MLADIGITEVLYQFSRLSKDQPMNHVTITSASALLILLAAGHSNAQEASVLNGDAAEQDIAAGSSKHDPTQDDTSRSPQRGSQSMDDDLQIGLLAGLLQPIFTDGANVQLEATIGRFVLDYSHGMSLDIPTAGEAKAQKLALHVPYSTGLGIGYRLTESFDLRFEPKLHQFDVGYESGAMAGERVARYKTATLGLGAYYRWRPFKSGAAKGIMVAPSLRFWQNVWSSLDGDQVTYTHGPSGEQKTHKTANIGIANTPLIVNVSVGYVFSL